MNEELKQALLTQGLEALEELIETKDGIIAKIRNQRRAMKSEGFTRAQVDFGLELRARGVEPMRLRIEKQIQIANWLGKPLGYQLALDI